MQVNKNLNSAYMTLSQRLDTAIKSCENEKKDLILLKMKIQIKMIKKQLEFLSFFTNDSVYNSDEWLCMSYGYAINAILTEVRNKCAINKLSKGSTIEMLTQWCLGMGLDYDWIRSYLKKLFNLDEASADKVIDSLVVKE